jgi:hypothetical protein
MARAEQVPADRLEAAPEDRTFGPAAADRPPSRRRLRHARPDVGLQVPVEELLRPLLRGLEHESFLSEPGRPQPPVGVGERRRELAQLGHECGPVERRKARASGDRPVQHGDVRVALEDLRVSRDEVEVEVGEHLVGVVAADPAEHDRDLGIGERRVQVLGPSLRRSGRPPFVARRVRHRLHPQAERLQVGDAALDPVKPCGQGAERGGHERDRHAALDLRRDHRSHSRQPMRRGRIGRRGTGAGGELLPEASVTSIPRG